MSVVGWSVRFQFLIGSLEALAWLELEELEGGVSIPHR